MKFLNKYFWFKALTLAFLIDSFLGYFGLIITGGWAETELKYEMQIMIYTTAKGVSQGLWFFYLLMKAPIEKMDLYDRLLAILSGIITIYSSLQLVMGALYVSMWYFWGFYIFFYLIIFMYKVKSIKKLNHAS